MKASTAFTDVQEVLKSSTDPHFHPRLIAPPQPIRTAPDSSQVWSKRGWLASISAVLLAISTLNLQAQAPAPAASTPTPPSPPPKFRDFNEVTRGMERFDGLFTLYKTNDALYGEIKPQMFDQPIIVPIAIARGLAMAGTPLNFGDEWILVFKRVGDKVQLLRRNIHYKAPENSPLQKAMKQNYTDSILMALPIVTMSPTSGGPLVDFGQIFLSDFAQIGFGSLDRNRSTVSKIKAFPNNVEIQVEATFSGRFFGGGLGSDDDGVADARGLTLVIHYSLAKLPDPGYKPRYADHRVGHFLNAIKDFGSEDPDTSFQRMINRWRLEKADPKAKLSPPKKQIVWWVEDTVPQEYRPYVEEGILEWNKAFEKIGFRNAISVRWQNERDEFDPEDINYCTFRWITTSSTFAMSGLRSNPLSGEIIDGDVIFDASWIRAWKHEYALLVTSPAVTKAMDNGEGPMIGLPTPIDAGEIISPILAAKKGYGLPFPLPQRQSALLNNGSQPGEMPELVPAHWSPWMRMMSKRVTPGKTSACQCMASKRFEFGLAAIALANVEGTNTDSKLPEEFLGQAIKEVVMHEVGHSLGLRHNFKASSMLSLEQINDPAITRVRGMVGSVMDYNPLNLARKGQKQGDFATTTIGPYDYWAIEYAYKQIDGDEASDLKKIASRSPEPDLTFGTDEDMYLSEDPLVNVYDLGNDVIQYGKQRVALANELLKTLDTRMVKDGESWARLRQAFSVLIGQYGNAAAMASGYIGAQHVSRDFKGEGGRDPIIPVSGEKQREALKFCVDEILNGSAFKFSPSLLRRLTIEPWSHWGSDSFYYYSGMDYKVYDRVLGIQRIVLSRCLDGGVLARILNQELQSDPNSKPIKISEVFSALTTGIWSDIDSDSVSTIRRNLQREHLRRLSNMVLGARRSGFEDVFGFVVLSGGNAVPADAKSLARLHLGEILTKVKKAEAKAGLDDQAKAHLQDCRQRISKVLEATYTSSDL